MSNETSIETYSQPISRITNADHLRKLRERVENAPIGCASPQTVVIGMRNMLGWFIDYLEGKPIAIEDPYKTEETIVDSSKGIGAIHPAIVEKEIIIQPPYYCYEAASQCALLSGHPPKSNDYVGYAARLEDEFAKAYNAGFRDGFRAAPKDDLKKFDIVPSKMPPPGEVKYVK